jgi:hypothetical protein
MICNLQIAENVRQCNDDATSGNLEIATHLCLLRRLQNPVIPLGRNLPRPAKALHFAVQPNNIAINTSFYK